MYELVVNTYLSFDRLINIKMAIISTRQKIVSSFTPCNTVNL